MNDPIFTNEMYRVVIEDFPYPDFPDNIRGYAVYNVDTGLREMECRTLPGAIGYATQLHETVKKLYADLDNMEHTQEVRSVN